MIVSNIKNLIDNLATATGHFSVSYSEPCFYNYETRQWSPPIPYGDKIGGVYLIASYKPEENWRLGIDSNDNDVLYIGKSIGDIRGRLCSHIEKVGTSFVAYIAKIEPFYYTRTIESFLLAVCIDESAFSLSKMSLDRLDKEYNIPKDILNKINENSDKKFKPVELVKYINDISYNLNKSLIDKQLFGILYLAVENAIKENKIEGITKLNDFTASI